jgi:hypothetical protein
VPAEVLLKAMLVAVPLQIDKLDGVAVITGIGFTVITAVVVAVQLLAVPVIVYVAVPGVLLLLLLNGCAIGLPVPEVAPVMVGVCTTLHV